MFDIVTHERGHGIIQGSRALSEIDPVLLHAELLMLARDGAERMGGILDEDSLEIVTADSPPPLPLDFNPDNVYWRMTVWRLRTTDLSSTKAGMA